VRENKICHACHSEQHHAVTGQKVLTASATSAMEIDAAFALIAQRRAGVLLVQTDPLLNSRRDQIVALALRHAVAAIASYREFALAGGLVSYGADTEGSWRLMGAYVARVLKGEKPADLPVIDPRVPIWRTPEWQCPEGRQRDHTVACGRGRDRGEYRVLLRHHQCGD
jgi:hypothetical protein